MPRTGRALLVFALVLLAIGGPFAAATAAGPEGQLTWAVGFSLAPTYFDPAEAPGLIAPFLIYYAVHDALVKPMPGQPLAPSLAESWSAAPDGLAYQFVLRKNARFHNGDPVTADDVKFSFERYRGVASKSFKARVAAIEVLDPHRVRFVLRQPWPDFMTFFGTPATGGAWIVPKKYVERVGDEGFKKAPVGAGPYRFVSFTPGVELVLEAFEPYWRKTPHVKAPLPSYDPGKARQLLAEAGYPNGFDGGTISSDLTYASIAEAVANYLGAVGVRLRVTPMERAAHTKAQQEKRLRGLNVTGTASFGNAASRIEAYVATGGVFAWGSYPDIDDLFQQQAAEPDRKRREA